MQRKKNMIIEMKDIQKHHDKFLALKDINFNVKMRNSYIHKIRSLYVK